MSPQTSFRILAASAAVFGLSVASAQTAPIASQKPDWSWPDHLKNAKVLPANIPGQQLGAIMKGFTNALGVRCTYCHVGEEEKPLSTYDFASDAKANKEIARAMLRMTQRINAQDLPAIAALPKPESDGPRVTCFTCHRGSTRPATMKPAAASSERGAA